jgi:RimJ/RimL family protein N-acetyltransferase
MLDRSVRTGRLVLRTWRDADLELFARLAADVEVMRYSVKHLTRAESESEFNCVREHWAQNGFGLWAVEVPGVHAFIGFVGLNRLSRCPGQRFTPCVEIGWRLFREYWGFGYATEGAAVALEDARGTVNIGEVVAFTAAKNLRSRRVMERIGMIYDAAEDFEYIAFPPGHPHRAHVLFRMGRIPSAPREDTQGSSGLSKEGQLKTGERSARSATWTRLRGAGSSGPGVQNSG